MSSTRVEERTTSTTAHPSADRGPEKHQVVRLSINLAASVADVLKESAATHQISITEAVRRAVALWKLVSDERAKGNRVMVVEGEGDKAKYRELVLL